MGHPGPTLRFKPTPTGVIDTCYRRDSSHHHHHLNPLPVYPLTGQPILFLQHVRSIAKSDVTSRLRERYGSPTARESHVCGNNYAIKYR